MNLHLEKPDSSFFGKEKSCGPSWRPVFMNEPNFPKLMSPLYLCPTHPRPPSSSSCCVPLVPFLHILYFCLSFLNATPPHLDPLLPFRYSPFPPTPLNPALSSCLIGCWTFNSGQQADHFSSLCHRGRSSCGCGHRRHRRAGGTR